MKLLGQSTAFCAFVGVASLSTRPSVALPEIDPVKPEVVGSFGPAAMKGNSGIVNSRRHDGVVWARNDSGDEAKVYPIRCDGSLWKAERYHAELNVRIAGPINVDWEDIAVDDQGHLIVCDVGNNRNDWRDVVLYHLDEPSPLAGRAVYKKKIFVRYADQRTYSATRDEFDFDCEGVFHAKGKLYLVSKNRSDTFGELYRLDHYESHEARVLTYIGRFDFEGKTTGADASQGLLA